MSLKFYINFLSLSFLSFAQASIEDTKWSPVALHLNFATEWRSFSYFAFNQRILYRKFLELKCSLSSMWSTWPSEHSRCLLIRWATSREDHPSLGCGIRSCQRATDVGSLYRKSHDKACVTLSEPLFDIERIGKVLLDPGEETLRKRLQRLIWRMLTIWCDWMEIIHYEPLQSDETVNSELY